MRASPRPSGATGRRRRSAAFAIAWCLLAGLLASCDARPTVTPPPVPTSDPPTWQAVAEGLAMRVPVVALAVAPTDPMAILAATGDEVGLYMSLDGGQAWRPAQGLEGLQIFALSIDPTQPQSALAGSNEGLFRSLDRGRTWQRVSGLPEGMLVYAITRDAAGTLYLGSDRREIWRSEDGGATWRTLAPLPAGSAVLSLAAAAGGQRLFAGVDGAVLWISQDRGRSWQKASGVGDTFVAGIWLLDDEGRVAFARGREALFRSLDHGATWRQVASDVEERIDSLAFSAADGRVYLAVSDGQVLAGRVDSDAWTPAGAGLGRSGAVFALQATPGGDGVLLAGTQSGLYRSSDHGATWQHVAHGLGRMPALGLARSADGAVYLATPDGVYISADAGSRWMRSSSGLPAVDILSVAVSPADPQIVYAGTNGQGLFRSADRGKTWSATALDVPAVPAIALHPVDRQRALVRAAFQRVYETRDGGESWQTPWDGMDLQTEVISLLVDPTDPARVFAGAVTGLYRSLDGGQRWQRVGPELEGQTVFALLVDPARPERVLAGATNGVYESLDGGERWAPLGSGSEQMTVTALAIPPAQPDTIFAGTKYQGVVRSDDRGRTWQPDVDGLGPLSVNALAVTPDGRWLLAATADGPFRRAVP